MVTEDAYIIPLLESSSMCQNRIKLFILFVVSYRFLIYELLIWTFQKINLHNCVDLKLEF